jgi:hypothetical protein
VTDNSLLIIVAGVLSALVHLVLNPLWLWLAPTKKIPNPFVLVLVYFPLGAVIIYAVLYVVYRLYLNSYP